MNYHKIEKLSIANGEGVRVVLWVSGCRLHCKGCHNPQTWDFKSGKPFDEKSKSELFEALNKPYVRGVTFSGGHPLEYENLPYIYDLIKEIKTLFPDKNIWLYTGYTLSIENFDNTVDICWDNGLLRNYVISMCDVIVDGHYVEEERDVTLPFRGSRNQRIINVKKTIEQGKIIELNIE